MAKTNRCNPTTMNPADRRHGCRGKGTGKEGAPPARRSARTNPSAAVGDFVDPRLLKPPPESIPHAPGAPGMPLLVWNGDVPPARAVPPYPLRNNRTTAPYPPAVIYCKVCAPGDVSLLNFRSPSLPPIYDGIPDVFIEGQELDFGQGAGTRGVTILLTTMTFPTMMKTLTTLTMSLPTIMKTLTTMLPLRTTMMMRMAITTTMVKMMTPTDWTTPLTMMTTTSGLMLISKNSS